MCNVNKKDAYNVQSVYKNRFIFQLKKIMGFLNFRKGFFWSIRYMYDEEVSTSIRQWKVF